MARILLIDDDDRFRTMLRRTLVIFGHDVIEARNGVDGWELLPHAGADLLIIDIMMPEKDGFEFLMELREKNPPMKIIAMSGGVRNSEVDFLEIARCLGAAKVLAKPFSNGALRAAVNELLADGKALVQPSDPRQ
jgi:CheY-like chemotaxis protein